MAALFEGKCNGKAVNVELGSNKNGKPIVRWEMEVIDGPHKGKRASYSGKLDEESIKYTKADMKRIGWKSASTRTFVEDVKAADLTVSFDAEIASTTYQDSGKTSEWTSVRFGRGAKALGALDADKQAEVDRWFASAPDLGGAEDDLPF